MPHVSKTINRGFQEKMRVCNFGGRSHSEGFRSREKKRDGREEEHLLLEDSRFLKKNPEDS